ncbi:hypothetical protein IC617_08885 [Neiella sp. HB171785]|uniref:Uncharacterized protein n=1 Tax=Neiella litorisoli TaxID=2771431 RepID=A0A8J6QU85_9GAMM|nr:hypothetical protein [Neiella litorisoli]MBD1389542.1 hypothetical protein [Neiella litorisoli]
MKHFLWTMLWCLCSSVHAAELVVQAQLNSTNTTITTSERATLDDQMRRQASQAITTLAVDVKRLNEGQLASIQHQIASYLVRLDNTSYLSEQIADGRYRHVATATAHYDDSLAKAYHSALVQNESQAMRQAQLEQEVATLRIENAALRQTNPNAATSSSPLAYHDIQPRDSMSSVLTVPTAVSSAQALGEAQDKATLVAQQDKLAIHIARRHIIMPIVDHMMVAAGATTGELDATVHGSDRVRWSIPVSWTFDDQPILSILSVAGIETKAGQDGYTQDCHVAHFYKWRIEELEQQLGAHKPLSDADLYYLGMYRALLQGADEGLIKVNIGGYTTSALAVAGGSLYDPNVASRRTFAVCSNKQVTLLAILPKEISVETVAAFPARQHVVP